MLGLASVGASQSTARDQALRVKQAVETAHDAGRLEQALEVLDVALDTLRLDPEIEAMLVIPRARIRRALGDPAGAEEDLGRVDALLLDNPYGRVLLPNAPGLRGELALDAGLVDIAAAHFAEERRLVDELSDGDGSRPVEWFHANRHFAELCMADGSYAELERWAVDLLASPAYQDPAARPQAALLETRLAYGLAEQEEADPRRAARAATLLETALADLPPFQQPRPRLNLATLLLRMDDDAGCARELDAVDELLRAMHPSGEPGFHPDRCTWTVVSAHRARLAGARLAGARLTADGGEASPAELERWRDALDAQVAAFVTSWSERPDRPGGYGPLLFHTVQDALVELVAHEVALHGEAVGGERALETISRVAVQGSLARALDAPLPTLAEVRDELLRGDPTHGVLLYLTGSFESRLLLVDVETVAVETLRREDALEWFRAAAARELASPRSPARDERLARHLARLSAELLPSRSRERTSRWNHWTVVGTDLLGEVPFEMLPRAAGALGVEEALDRLPSLPVGVALVRRLRRRPADVRPTFDARLFVAPQPPPAAVALVPGLPALPLDAVSAGDLLSPETDGVLETLLGEEATSALLAGDGPDALAWQLLGHGVSDTSLERPVALAFAATAEHDGLLHAPDIERLSAPPLVVVTACRAGRSPLRRGDPGSADLGGAFLRAGAAAVVLSHWDLGLDAVGRLSSAFHRTLRSGATPAEALRRARAELAAEHPEDVAAWGSLQLVGLGGVPLHEVRSPGSHTPGMTDAETVTDPEGSPPFLLWAAAAGVVVLLGLVLLRGRRES